MRWGSTECLFVRPSTASASTTTCSANASLQVPQGLNELPVCVCIILELRSTYTRASGVIGETLSVTVHKHCTDTSTVLT